MNLVGWVGWIQFQKLEIIVSFEIIIVSSTDRMAAAIDIQTNNDLAYQWLTANGVNFDKTCALLHSGSCSLDQLKKAFSVAKIGMKYYVSFHLIPLVLRLKKCKDKEQFFKLMGKSIVQYVRSVLFITFLVTGMKTGQCITVNTNVPYLEGSLTGFGIVSAMSIFFEHHSRRQQIGYFVLAKAFRSTYKGMKRMRMVSIPRQFCTMHVVFMTAIYYVYCNHPDLLKFKNIFEMFLGD